MVEVKNPFIILLTFIIAFSGAIALAIPTYCVYFYIHEAGHMIFGYFGSLIVSGQAASFNVTNWIEFPGLEFIKLPQQTKMTQGQPTLFFTYGGVVFIVAMVSLLSYFILRRLSGNGRAMIFFYPVFFSVHELIGNVVCGSDNPSGHALNACNQYPIFQLFIQYAFFILALINVIFLYRRVEHFLCSRFV